MSKNTIVLESTKLFINQNLTTKKKLKLDYDS